MAKLDARVLTLACALVLGLCAPAAAQTPFTISAVVDGTLLNVTNGDTLNLSVPAVGATSTVNLGIVYRGSTSVVIGDLSLSGAGDFALTTSVRPPVTMTPGQSLSVTLRFTATTPNRVTGRLLVSYKEGQNGPNATLTLNLTGSAPGLALSFIPQPDGNVMAVAGGSTLPFPATALDGNSTGILSIANRGSAPATVNSVAVQGDAFSLFSLPLLPASVAAGAEVRINVRFTPKQLGPQQGSLKIDLGGTTVSLGLQGTGAGALFAYELTRGGAGPLAPGSQIGFADTAVGDRISVTVQVRNTGNADGRISDISITGSGFQVGDLPFLPVTLAPQAVTTFTVTFNPSQPGKLTGRLKVGSDTFDLSGLSLGSLLIYSFANGSNTTTVPGDGTVIFAPVAVAETATGRFTIRNTGTAAATVASIGLASPGAVFTVSGLPTLPATIAPDQSIGVDVTFAPNNVGGITATLRVDARSFTLSGIGTAPTNLPQARFSGPGANVDPATQPALSLRLVSAYPLPLAGTLTLAYSSTSVTNEPAAQFVTGGRTVNFTVPANTTDAVFADGSGQVRFQTGTVAGNITITPSFRTDAGLNVTPASPAVMAVAVPAGAPRLSGIQLGTTTANSLTLVVTGFSPTRAATSMEVRFTPVAGVSAPSSQFTTDVAQAFSTWYQNSQSQAFGSNFTASITFTLQGQGLTTGALEAIQSVAVTLSNAQGASNPVSLALR